MPNSELIATLERQRDALLQDIREISDQLLETSLTTFTFDTITLDETGEEIDRRTLTARQFIEDLGDNVKLEIVEIPGGKFMMGTSAAPSIRTPKATADHRPSSALLCSFFNDYKAELQMRVQLQIESRREIPRQINNEMR
jgi:hypothetical protein